MTSPVPRRSALFLPASNPRAVEKARGLDADIVILDLEDAVAPDRKAEARAAAVAAVQAGGFQAHELWVRVNALDSAWGRDDLRAVAAARPHAILAPKVSSARDVDAYAAHLKGSLLWVMIETARAVSQLQAIADRAGEVPLAGFVIGPNDLAMEMRSRPDAARTGLVPILSLAVAAARATGLAILDGVCNDFRDEDRLRRECEQGRMLGFDGKTLIHPAQIATANAVFAPSAAEIAWAGTVRDAFASPEAEGRGAIQVDGRMVERLHLNLAERTLALADAIRGSR